MVMPRSRSRSIESSNCVLHVARGDRAGAVQQPVGKRRLAVVNVGNDAEISYVRGVHRVF